MNVVLVGHYRPGYRLAYYFDWRDAFVSLEKPHSARVIDTWQPGRRPLAAFERLPAALSLPVRELRAVYAGDLPCDLLVYGMSFYYFNQGTRRRFFEDLVSGSPRRFATAYFMENEFRLLDEKVALANRLRADVLVSQFTPDVAERLYGPYFRGRILSCPPGLNPDVFRPVVPIADRPLHVGTRSHRYPVSLGDSERNSLLEAFARAEGPLAGLRLDVSFADEARLPREGWAAFLNSCRATVSTETGAVELRVRPEGPAVSGKVISSRHFEALGTKTVQLMFGGRFNDILRAGEHYLPVARDLGNLAEIRSALEDVALLQTIADAAHELALSGHTYAHRVRALLAAA